MIELVWGQNIISDYIIYLFIYLRKFNQIYQNNGIKLFIIYFLLIIINLLYYASTSHRDINIKKKI